MSTENLPTDPDHTEQPDPTVGDYADSDLRARLIDRYLDSGLEDANPLVGNVIAVNSDMMRIQLAIRQAIEAAMADKQSTLQNLENLMPGIELMARNAKQIEQFSKLQVTIQMHARRQPNSAGLPGSSNGFPQANFSRFGPH